jgi:uncharacterized protein YjbI with pentapeptide repeats
MANAQHIDMLFKGVDCWNKWRSTASGAYPDLSRANLASSEVSLRNYDFSNAKLEGAKLAKLALSLANFTGSNLTGADLSNCHLLDCNFTGACMKKAKLNSSMLTGAVFDQADLREAQFHHAYLLGTTFTRSDLSSAFGLVACNIGGAVLIDDDTIVKSWPISEDFLKGCGLAPEHLVRLIETIDKKPDLFLCYSSRDKEFVRNLENDLSALHVNVWLDEKELGPGDSLHESIGRALEASAYVGVVVSESSVDSDWFKKELSQALSRETRDGRCVVLPILCGKVRMPAFLEDKVCINFSSSYYESLAKLAARLKGADYRTVAKHLSQAPPKNTEDAAQIVDQALKSLPAMGPFRKSLYMATDMPIDFLGTRTGNVLLQLDRWPVQEDDVARAFHEALSFPILKNDEERTDYLKLCCISHELDEIIGVRNPLKIVGTEIIRIHSRKLLDLYCQHEDVARGAAEKLIATLRDHARHSMCLGLPEDDLLLMITINTWYGRFEEVASKNRGDVLTNVEAALSNAPQSVCAVLCLDYYVVDADALQEQPFYLSLAVSFFPRLADKLPSYIRFLLVHKEMLNRDQWQKFEEAAQRAQASQ